MFIQVGIFLIVVHKMAQGGLLALHTQQVLVSGQHDVPGQNEPSTRACSGQTFNQGLLEPGEAEWPRRRSWKVPMWPRN